MTPLRVKYGLPDSPIQKVAYEGVSPSGEATPQRKPRRLYKAQNPKRKRQKGSHVFAPIVVHEGESTSQTTINPSDVFDMDGLRAENNWPSDDILTFQTSPRVPLQATEIDDSYFSFVEAVLSDECSFYQLSQKLFVVNGWNIKKNETSVSFFHRYMTILTSRFIRRHGSICNKIPWRSPEFIAFVQKVETVLRSVFMFAL